MKWEFFSIAFKNLNRQKKRSFLIGGAIAFGLCILFMVNSFTRGFIENAGDNLSGLYSGHIFISGFELEKKWIIRKPEEITDKLRESKIPLRNMVLRTVTWGDIIYENHSVFQEIFGIDWNEEKSFKQNLSIKSGSIFDLEKDRQGILISDKMAERLNAVVGDTLIVRLRTSDDQMNAGEFRIRAISRDSSFISSMKIYTHKEYVNELINLPAGSCTVIGLRSSDVQQSEAEAWRLHEYLKKNTYLHIFPFVKENDLGRYMYEYYIGKKTKYYISSISRTNVFSLIRNIASAFTVIGFVVAALLLCIISVGIMNTFRMIVYERTREIGTMRALGMHTGDVKQVFLLEALILSFGGTVAGLIFSFPLMALIHSIYLGTSNPLFIFLNSGRITFIVSPGQMLLYILIVCSVTLLAAYIPVRKAARIKPAYALRHAS